MNIDLELPADSGISARPGQLYPYSAFGLHLVSDQPLPGFLIAPTGVAELQVFFGGKVLRHAGQKSIRREVPEVPGLVFETIPGSDSMEIRIVHESGSIFLMIKDATVNFEWSRGIDARTVEAVFCGIILKSIALWRQKFALHAGATENPGGKALVIAGKKGAGKSTLLAGFYAAGARIVAEDMATLSQRGGNWRVHSGARILKLLPQAAAALVRSTGQTRDTVEWHSDHPSAADYLRNQKVLMDTTARDGVRGPDSLPLAAIYLLGSRLPADAAVALERLGKPQAVASLAQELSEVPEMLEPREDKKAALQSLLALVQDVPIYRLHLPNDLSRVQTIARQLLQGALATV
jgi:hypothetical protein